MPKTHSLAWIDDGHKTRPAIVLSLAPDGTRWIALLGQENPFREPRMYVEPLSRAGRMLGLSKRTYFFPKPALVTAAAVRKQCGSCPLGDVERAEALLATLEVAAPEETVEPTAEVAPGAASAVPEPKPT